MARAMPGAGPDPNALTAKEFVMTRFAANLVRCRREAGMSQDEVALRASMNRTEVSSLERGLRSPRVETVVKLAGALEVEPGRLFEGPCLAARRVPLGPVSRGARRRAPRSRWERGLMAPGPRSEFASDSARVSPDSAPGEAGKRPAQDKRAGFGLRSTYRRRQALGS